MGGKTSHLLTFIRIAWRIHPVWFATRVVLTIITSLIPIGQLLVAQKIIDALIVNTSAGQTTVSFGHITFLILVEMSLFLANALLSRIDGMVNDMYIEQLRLGMMRRMLDKTAELDVASYEDDEFNKHIERIYRDTWWRPHNLYDSLFQTLAAAVTLMASISLFLTLPAWIVVGLVLAALPTFWLQTRYGQRIYEIDTNFSDKERLADYYGWALTHRVIIADVKLFNLEKLFAERFNSLWNWYVSAYADAVQRFLLYQLGATVVSVAARTGIYFWLVFAVLGRRLTIGQLTLYIGLVGQLVAGIKQLLGELARISNQFPYLENLKQFLDREPLVREPVKPRRLPKNTARTITFDHVWFRYPGQAKWVLRDVSFTIEAGQHVALVGENGAGKTTIVKLMARFYDPDRGRILIDGTDIREFRLRDLHRYIGLIFQNFARFQAEVAENIGFGAWANRADERSLVQAAERSGAASFIRALPAQYRTMLTSGWTTGTELSGGQWQRLALARTFFHDARLLVLDEPTAALDPVAEEHFYRQFLQMGGDVSAILISHRFATVRMADTILVLDKGLVIERGSHAELMRENGRYAQLFQLQASRYQESTARA